MLNDPGQLWPLTLSIPGGACREASQANHETKARPSLEDQATSNSQAKVRHVITEQLRNIIIAADPAQFSWLGFSCAGCFLARLFFGCKINVGFRLTRSQRRRRIGVQPISSNVSGPAILNRPISTREEKGTQPIPFGTLIAVNLKLFYSVARFLRKTPHQLLLVHGEQTHSNRYA